MNEVVLMGRLTKDPDIRYTQEAQPMCIARYTLAVDRGVKREGQQSADFISCVAFGKNGEFAEKYLHKGMKICLSGRIQTGSYTRQDGQKVYTTDVVVAHQEFAESKVANDAAQNYSVPQPEKQPENQGAAIDGFMHIPDGIDEELPFN